MREVLSHGPGKIFLASLVLSIVGFIVLVAMGVMGSTALLFGWMTMSLVLGVGFVLFWLVAYIIYFFFFWPYR